MRASRKSYIEVGVVAVTCFVASLSLSAQTTLESPAFSDPHLFAAIFAPQKPAPSYVPRREADLGRSSFGRDGRDIRVNLYRPPIPKDWQAFEERFAPEQYPDQPHLQLLENGMYEFNQTLYSLKLFERDVNSLLSFEYSMRELSGYDSRSRENKLDNFFDHAKVKTEFDWDAPIGLYVGVKLQIKCDSIFQFWK
jgi:hypothetical protein